MHDFRGLDAGGAMKRFLSAKDQARHDVFRGRGGKERVSWSVLSLCLGLLRKKGNEQSFRSRPGL